MSARSRAIVAEELAGAGEAIYLTDLPPPARADALRRAGAVLASDTSKELHPGESSLIGHARLLQFSAAGIDWVPTRDLPPTLPVAGNKGASAEPMAEHVAALVLAAAKRLFVEHDELKRGAFHQHSPNRMLRGAVCGILGFGAVGVATARLMRAFGMKIHALNRRGVSTEPTDWIGTTERLDLPNVIGSPHNSAGGGVWREVSLRRAVANCRRALLGETPLNLIGPDERML
jgi:phosphoglycerate dehydrogenase-like enzyme